MQIKHAYDTLLYVTYLWWHLREWPTSRRPSYQQWWAKSNRDSIQSRFESQRRFDSNIARFDSSSMRFDTDSIQILTIRFKRHAIWTEISKSWLKLNRLLIVITHYSVRSYLQMFSFTHHWCMPAIIRSLLLSGEGFKRRDQCTWKRCSENGNSNGYHWPERSMVEHG